jgi:hypothetical protein
MNIGRCIESISFVVQAQADERMRYLAWNHIGWSRSNWTLGLLIPTAICILGLIGIIVFISWRSNARESASKKKAAEQRFGSAIERLELSDDDQAVIRTLHAHVPHEPISSIIEKPEIFEKGVDAELALDLPASSAAGADALAARIGTLRKKCGFLIYPPDWQLYSTRVIPLGLTCSIFGASNRDPLIASASVIDMSERSMRLRFNPQQARLSVLTGLASVRLAFSRANDGFYGAAVPVLGFPAADLIELGHTIQLKRSQLRKHVRISVITEVKCRMLTPAEAATSTLAPAQQIDVRMHDISGGGLSFIHGEKLHAGDILSLSFQLGATRIAGLRGTVLRISERNTKGAREFLHHIKFHPIEVNEQEKIIRFTFERMRLLSSWNMKRFR